MKEYLWWLSFPMTTSLEYNQNFLDDEGSVIRPATIFSSIIHFVILIIAIYGIPNFGRELPPDITVIPFDFLKVVEETNTDINAKDYVEIEKKTNVKKESIQEEKLEKKITPAIKKDPIIEEIIVPTKKPDLISKNTIPIEKPKIPVSPSKKPKLASEKEIPIKKPQKNTKISTVQKPIMKPQIKKEKNKKNIEKKNKTNPNALTTVLKTLEKIKDTNKQKKILKETKQKLEDQKRNNASKNMKDMVSNVLSSKPKNFLKPIGISEIDLLKSHIGNHWTPPIGAAGAENLIVDIFMEFNKGGYVLKAEWVNKGLNGNNSFYKAAANAAIRAVKDSEPIPLPASKFKEWRTLTFRFDPATMFGGY